MPSGEILTYCLITMRVLSSIYQMSFPGTGTRAFWENPNSLLLVDLLSLRIWISSIIRTLFPITRLSARDR